jgi:hypothetical protein
MGLAMGLATATAIVMAMGLAMVMAMGLATAMVMVMVMAMAMAMVMVMEMVMAMVMVQFFQTHVYSPLRAAWILHSRLAAQYPGQHFQYNLLQQPGSPTDESFRRKEHWVVHSPQSCTILLLFFLDHSGQSCTHFHLLPSA